MTGEERMARDPMWRLFAGMSLPAVLVTLVMVLYSMADIYFVGRLGDAEQVAAITAVAPAYGAIQGMGTLLGMGGCTAAALALGRGEREEVAAVSGLCLWGSLALGALLAAAGAAFAPALCRAMGAQGDTLPYAVSYMRVLALGAPGILLSNVLGNLLRHDGSTREAVIGSAMGSLINIALDPLLIGGLGLGVAGAAWATVAGGAASCAYLVARLRARRQGGALSPRALRGRGRLLMRIAALGAPMAVSTLLSSCASALGNGVLARYGAEALAASGIAGKAGMIVGMVAIGICTGIQPAISFCSGVDRERALHITRCTALFSLAVCALISGTCFMLRGGFMAAFIDDARVIDLGTMMLTASLLTCPLAGVYQTCAAFLQATGRTSRALALSVLRQGAIYLPCLYLMEQAAGLSGLIYAAPLADVLSLAAGVALCLSAGMSLIGRRSG
ncbi:MAG: MATE family efflux transporter [Candidatus Fimadaptatus sp.]